MYNKLFRSNKARRCMELTFQKFGTSRIMFIAPTDLAISSAKTFSRVISESVEIE